MEGRVTSDTRYICNVTALQQRIQVEIIGHQILWGMQGHKKIVKFSYV
jgi:hypothetical protein